MGDERDVTPEQVEQLIASVVTWIGAHSADRHLRQQQMCSLLTRYGVRVLRLAREAKKPKTMPGLVQYNALAAEVDRLQAEVDTATGHVRALVAAMDEWGSWEDGVPAPIGVCGGPGRAYDAAKVWMAAKGAER